MGTYGLKVWDSSSNVVLDTSDRITRFRYSTLVSSGVSSSVNLPDISGLSTVQFAMPLTAALWQATHLVTRSGTTIYWTARSLGTIASANCMVLVFIYD